MVYVHSAGYTVHNMRIVILLITLAILGVGWLVLHFAPKSPSEDANIYKNTPINTSWRPSRLFGKSATETIDTKTAVKSGTREISDNDDRLNAFLSAWQDEVTQATSAQIAVIATSSTQSEGGSRKNAALNNLGNILERLNKQLNLTTSTNSSISARLSDDYINSWVYFKSYVDLGDDTSISSAGSEELREYGNTLAKKLTTFRIIQGDQLATLDAFIKNSTSSANQGQITKLAQAYNGLSEDIANIEVPVNINNINNAIAESLAEMSEQLHMLSTAREETDIYNKALQYNKTSVKLAKSTLELIDAFKFAGVKFKIHEPGSIFMFK